MAEKRIKLSILRNLPVEIILSEILPRLPVKSLLRFKRVSKSWLSLISTNKFVKIHLQLSAATTPITDYNAITVSKSGSIAFCFNINNHPVGSMFSESSMDVHQFDSSYTLYARASPRIVGCCNGMSCIIIKGHFLLWNPSTKEIRKLPVVWDGGEKITIHGFGYDESNDDYKVVVMWTVWSNNVRKPVFRLYSLKTDSWKTLNDFPDRDTFGGPGIFGGKGTLLNGKLHWMSDKAMEILSFDLGMEVAQLVELPSCTKSLYRRMGMINGCLSVTRYNENEGIELWIMKEYGVKESWCRLVTVPHYDISFNIRFKRSSNQILCISSDRVVLRVATTDESYGLNLRAVDDKSTLYIYNPKTDHVSDEKLEVSQTSEVDFCIQSLVSPFHQVN